MGDFFIPSFDAVSDTPVCAEGRHTATATNFESGYSKSSGNPMMIVEWTVDMGDEAGHVLVEYIVLGGRGRFGERKLKKICQIVGYKWRTKADLDEFVSQFPRNVWRLEVDVEHEYSKKVDKPGGSTGWESITKEDYEELPDDDNRSIQARIKGYYEHEAADDEEYLTFEDRDEAAGVPDDDDDDDTEAPW